MTFRIGNNRGFTMIELMAAVVILTTGLVLILQGLSSGMFVLNRAQRQYLATRIAAEKLEGLQEEAIRQEGLDTGSESESVTLQGKHFSVTTEINPRVIETQKFPQIFLPDEEPEGYAQAQHVLQQADVRVSWQERAALQELTVTTYFEKSHSE
ncbi:prepilin-type N-terminal cleavage/methylation domain-containing protein [Candidatus Omnitrophota bacterium]